MVYGCFFLLLVATTKWHRAKISNFISLGWVNFQDDQVTGPFEIMFECSLIDFDIFENI